MPTTKSNTVVHDNITLTAGSGDTTSSAQDLTTSYGAVVFIKLTNGVTGPTAPAQIQIEASGDGSTNWYDYGGPMQGDDAANGVYSFFSEFPIGIPYVRFVSGSNTGQNVTLRVELVQVIAVS